MGSDQNKNNNQSAGNRDQQAVDKNPGEERGKSEQVTNEDLKGKKVDRDITKPEDEPSH